MSPRLQNRLLITPPYTNQCLINNTWKDEMQKAPILLVFSPVIRPEFQHSDEFKSPADQFWPICLLTTALMASSGVWVCTNSISSLLYLHPDFYSQLPITKGCICVFVGGMDWRRKRETGIQRLPEGTQVAAAGISLPLGEQDRNPATHRGYCHRKSTMLLGVKELYTKFLGYINILPAFF